MKSTLTILSLSLLLISCTDSRTVKSGSASNLTRSGISGLTKVSEVRFNEKDFDAFQINSNGNNLYLSGTQIAFSKWEIRADAELPRIVFAAHDNIGTTDFTTFGAWTPANLASGALSVIGSWAYLSGAAGLSVVDMGDTSRPVERARYPQSTGTDINRDPNFVYKALVAHPTLPVLYGFREQDYVYTLNANGQNVSIAKQSPYTAAGQNTCCVMGAAVFQNKLYVAFTQSLWIYSFGANGELTGLVVNDQIKPVGISATTDTLYIYHQPAKSSSISKSIGPAGIYAFDAGQNLIGFVGGVQPYSFAVSQDNSHLYANIDQRAVTIYQINWNSIVNP